MESQDIGAALEEAQMVGQIKGLPPGTFISGNRGLVPGIPGRSPRHRTAAADLRSVEISDKSIIITGPKGQGFDPILLVGRQRKRNTNIGGNSLAVHLVGQIPTDHGFVSAALFVSQAAAFAGNGNAGGPARIAIGFIATSSRSFRYWRWGRKFSWPPIQARASDWIWTVHRTIAAGRSHRACNRSPP